MAKKKTNTTQYATRPAIVTVMGHVDHGKTSILDFIRKTNIQTKEHGGITQHIGAYQIEHNDKFITFIDTPGHAAFTQMRARGGRAADIVVLVVAADESVKPQTREAVAHINAAGATTIVAINKMDLSSADPKKVKQELAQENVLVEDWGGDVISVEVSAKTGDGVDKLLDSILAVSEILDLKADPKGELEAIIIESKLDRKRGVMVSAVVRNGTINVGDEVSASGQIAKIKSMTDDKGVNVKTAGPAKPVEILGFKQTPNIGDLIIEKGSDLEELAQDENKMEIIGQKTKKTVGIILKADTHGTLEAIKASLANLVTESVGADFSIKFVLTSTGEVNDSDILLASSTNGVVIGFNVIVKSSATDLANEMGISVKQYNTIYELVDDVKILLEGTATKEEAKIKGRAKVLKTFKLPSGDVIAGCEVIAGIVKVNQTVRVFDIDPADITEEDEHLYIGKIKKLKREKDDIKTASKSSECGVLLKPQFDDLKKGMWLEIA